MIYSSLINMKMKRGYFNRNAIFAVDCWIDFMFLKSVDCRRQMAPLNVQMKLNHRYCLHYQSE